MNDRPVSEPTVTLIGGIFGRGLDYQESIHPTTELVLARLLRSAGLGVVTYSPRDIVRFITRRQRPHEVIHIHHPGRLTTLLSIVGSRAPIVYTPHRTNLPPSRVLSLGHRRMIRTVADRVVALSPDEAITLRNQYGVSDDRICIIPNGFALPHIRLNRREAPSKAERWRLLFVGQLLPVKRPFFLVEMLAQLTVEYDIEVVLVSQNPTMLEELQSLAEARRVADRLVFLGALSPMELAVEYERAHGLMLPSEAEALPSVITEAIRSGLPVVASDVGGVRWQMDGINLCIPMTGVSDFVSGVRLLLQDYERFSRAAFDNSRRLSTRFTEERMVAEHTLLYRVLACPKED